jgi:hypothetical protein
MMAMFGGTDPKMPAHYIAQMKPGKAWSGMDKIAALDVNGRRTRRHRYAPLGPERTQLSQDPLAWNHSSRLDCAGDRYEKYYSAVLAYAGRMRRW